MRYLEIKALSKTKFNNDVNLLGEKLARQHEQKKRWNISAKIAASFGLCISKPTTIPLSKLHITRYYVSILYCDYFRGQVNMKGL